MYPIESSSWSSRIVDDASGIVNELLLTQIKWSPTEYREIGQVWVPTESGRVPIAESNVYRMAGELAKGWVL